MRIAAYQQLIQMIKSGNIPARGTLTSHIESLSNIELDSPDPETGATPLGLAITLLRTDAVQLLLQAGANPNLATGLKGKEQLKPLTIAVGKQHPSTLTSLQLAASSSDLKDAPHDPRYCRCQQARADIIHVLLSHPHLQIGEKDSKGLSVLDWARLFDAPVKDSQTYNLLLSCQQLLTDFSDRYQQGGTSLNFNPEDKNHHHSQVKLLIKHKRTRTEWVAKFYDQKQEAKADDLKIVNSLTHTKAFETVFNKKPRYCLYTVKDQWWVCGHATEGEIITTHIELPGIKTNLPDKEKLLLIEGIQKKLKMTRDGREVVAKEFDRLFYPAQPRYQMVTDFKNQTTGVISRRIPNFQELNHSLLRQPINGFEEILINILISNDIDPKLQNLGINDQNDLISIDGDCCFARLRDHPAFDQFQITARDLNSILNDHTLKFSDYHFGNFLDITNGGRVTTKESAYNALLQKPGFDQRFCAAILKRIIVPSELIKEFVTHYIKDPFEVELLANQFISRIEQLRIAAMQNKKFCDYLASPQADQDLQDYLPTLFNFKTKPFIYLCKNNQKLKTGISHKAAETLAAAAKQPTSGDEKEEKKSLPPGHDHEQKNSQKEEKKQEDYKIDATLALEKEINQKLALRKQYQTQIATSIKRFNIIRRHLRYPTLPEYAINNADYKLDHSPDKLFSNSISARSFLTTLNQSIAKCRTDDQQLLFDLNNFKLTIKTTRYQADLEQLIRETQKRIAIYQPSNASDAKESKDEKERSSSINSGFDFYTLIHDSLQEIKKPTQDRAAKNEHLKSLVVCFTTLVSQIYGSTVQLDLVSSRWAFSNWLRSLFSDSYKQQVQLASYANLFRTVTERTSLDTSIDEIKSLSLTGAE